MWFLHCDRKIKVRNSVHAVTIVWIIIIVIIIIIIIIINV